MTEISDELASPEEIRAHAEVQIGLINKEIKEADGEIARLKQRKKHLRLQRSGWLALSKVPRAKKKADS